MVFMTDDAVPADRELIGALVKGLSLERAVRGIAAVAYARQLPNRDCAWRKNTPGPLIIRRRAMSRRRAI